MTAERIELEAKVAILERTVDALSGELHQLAKQLEAMKQSIQRLAEQLAPKQSDPDFDPHNTPPPHY